VLMSHSDFPRSIGKRASVFLVASLVTTSIMLSLETPTSLSLTQVVGQLPGGKAQDPLQAQDSLQKYADISALPLGEKRTAFSNASPKDRSDFVRIHLALYLAKHAELNEAQRALILEFMSFLTPELYDVRSDGPDRLARVPEGFRQASKRIRDVFPNDEGVRVFATLGVPEADDLLKSYRDISALPMADRRATFIKATPKGRSDLVRIHLALYLARNGELNEAQKGLILEFMSFLTPELYDVRSDDHDRLARVSELLRQFQNRILAVFSREEAARIFATLGPPEQRDDLLQKVPCDSAPPSENPPTLGR
jgi:DNA-binding MarR family transcriptional regulator